MSDYRNSDNRISKLPLTMRHRLEDLREARAILHNHCEEQEKRYMKFSSELGLFKRLKIFLSNSDSDNYSNKQDCKEIVITINERLASLEVEYQALFEQAILLLKLAQRTVINNSTSTIAQPGKSFTAEYGPDWPTIAEECKKRDGYQCIECGLGRPEVVLHAHHVLERGKGGQDTLSNLITLCEACHASKHDHMRNILWQFSE